MIYHLYLILLHINKFIALKTMLSFVNNIYGALFIFSIGSFLDYYTTSIAIQIPFLYEANPIMSSVIAEYGVEFIFYYKFAFLAPTLFLSLISSIIFYKTVDIERIKNPVKRDFCRILTYMGMFFMFLGLSNFLQYTVVNVMVMS